MSIAVYTITSPLHDKQSIETYTKEFFSRLKFDFDYKGEDSFTWGQADLDLIFVRTGGTENLFRQRYMDVLQARKSVYLLASSNSNSLAASMEILSWLRQRGIKGEILHGPDDYVSSRISQLVKLETARKTLRNTRAAVIGRPSDWLIASDVNKEAVQAKLGFDIGYIPIEEVENICGNVGPKEDGAITIYNAIKSVVTKHQINAFTIRCFDLLTSLRNTGCLALAKLNSEGYVAGCEGDAPAMVSMIIARSLTGKSGFQANPARVDTEKGEVLFTHCTIPLDMVERYEFDTHFESGIGVGIRGYMKEGPVTVFKVSGDLSRVFAEEGELIENGKAPNLCRTQQLIRFSDKQAAKYFLQDPIGNHHIILQGHWKTELMELLK